VERNGEQGIVLSGPILGTQRRKALFLNELEVSADGPWGFRLEGDVLLTPRVNMGATVQSAPDQGLNIRFVWGQSAAIQNVNKTVEEIAGTGIPVLLVGESGAGKEVYARLIHRLSQNSHEPLSKLSCRALGPAQFLAELRDLLKRGPRHNSNGGRTVFLDGVDELETECQTALLSMLPDGDHEQVSVDPTRLITSSSRNIEKEVEGGRFRKELFFRINGVCLRLPALRDRKEDIPLLLDCFLARHAAEANRGLPNLGQKELELLGTHDWPGNIRELENFARKISLRGEAREALEELHNTPRISTVPAGEPQGISLKVAARTASRQAERELIRAALERTHWNRKRAAEQLKISYKSLLYKIKQTGLEGR
jgi:two-component system, NtrC family, response regulator AtoC